MYGFDTNMVYGFDTTVLTHSSAPQPIQGAGSSTSKSSHNQRLFLLSNNSTPPIRNKKGSKKKKTTGGRKRVTKEPLFQYYDEVIQVNSEKSGIYEGMFKQIIDELDATIKFYKRVLVYRFDLHQEGYSPNNTVMTNFRKCLIQKIQRSYGIKDIGYVWVRELEKAKAQHYHWALFLDGDKIRHPAQLKKIIKHQWEKATQGNHMPTIQNPFYFVNNPEIRREVIYRISYLAKARGKGYRDVQAKDYATSRLKAKLQRKQIQKLSKSGP